jgi:serine/threonine-protein kinase RIO1
LNGGSTACFRLNDTNRREEIEGAAIDRSTYAINVQWYTQKVISILEYHVEGGDNAQPIVQSNNKLSLTGFDEHMHQVFGTRTCVPRQRSVRSNRLEDFEYSLPRQNLQTTKGDWYRREHINLWKMNAQIRVQAMDRLGLWNE